MVGTWRSSARRRTVGLLLGLALVVRLLVPTGWMPEVDAAGIRLAWCGSAGPPPPAFAAAMAETSERLGAATDGQMPSDRDDPDADHHKPGGDQPCAYAGLASVAIEPIEAPLLAPPGLAGPVPIVVEATPGRGLAAPPPPATGPPILI